MLVTQHQRWGFETGKMAGIFTLHSPHQIRGYYWKTKNIAALHYVAPEGVGSNDIPSSIAKMNVKPKKTIPRKPTTDVPDQAFRNVLLGVKRRLDAQETV